MSKRTIARRMLAGAALSGAILAPAAGVALADPAPAPPPGPAQPAPGQPARDAAFWDRYDQWSVKFAQCLERAGVNDPSYDRVNGWSGGAQAPRAKAASQQCQSIVGLPPTVTEK
ncbi:hypothetical protein AXK56_10915 [Tsukamurella pulmonis]|uniref:Uncharacterized protein n=1 Tax=Tsukamurella pulmonis TaxID=47312 RepID=A0A1H1GEI0_9ACTN|nr:hypothetical protein [Tsukamurella pulmonis]KXO88465.1 hypothetical protein AXK56_10915 [Tsukamurella pulmonis]SDR11493.1 hypothetical protein SAMN04489765_3282 [Tsukamurella pulmonis]SUP17402.1 Uncharacterised protein [Tsukamurella pulmonis]